MNTYTVFGQLTLLQQYRKRIAMSVGQCADEQLGKLNADRKREHVERLVRTFEIIKSTGKTTPYDISNALRVTTKTAGCYIRELRDANKVRIIETRRPGIVCEAIQ